MSPDFAIAMLDEQIAEHGRTVVLRRGADDITTKVFMRPSKPDELVPGKSQRQDKIVMSPTGIEALLPIRSSDRLVYDGREHAIEGEPLPILIGETTVRINFMVR